MCLTTIFVCLTLLHGTLSCNSTPEKVTVPLKKVNTYLTLHCFTKQIRYFTFKSNDFVHQCLIYFIPFFQANSSSPFYDFKAIDIDGVEQSLSKYAGHVCIVVNVASK